MCFGDDRRGSVKLAGLDSVAALGIKKQEQPLPDNTPVDPKNIVKVGPNAHLVRENFLVV